MISPKFLDLLIRKATSEKRRDQMIRMLSWFPESIIRLLMGRYVKTISPDNGTKKGPEGLFFFLTNSCNQKCAHCFYADELNSGPPPLSLENIRTIANSVRGSVSNVVLCGGEPTVRKDLPEIGRAFVELGQVTTLLITSNGLLHDRLFKAVTHILESKRNFYLHIIISFDGLPDIHDAIRKSPGGFDKAFQAIKRLEEMALTDNRLRPIINSVIQKQNADTFMEFYRMIRESTSCEFVTTFIRQDNRDVGGLDQCMLLDAGNEEDLLPDMATCESLIGEIKEYEESLGTAKALTTWRSLVKERHLRTVRDNKSAFKCLLPTHTATIWPDGNTSICELVKPYGNLKDYDYDLVSCWNSPVAQVQKDQLSSCWCTYPCALNNGLMHDPEALTEAITKVRMAS